MFEFFPLNSMWSFTTEVCNEQLCWMHAFHDVVFVACNAYMLLRQLLKTGVSSYVQSRSDDFHYRLFLTSIYLSPKK